MMASGPDPDRLIETIRKKKVLTGQQMVEAGRCCLFSARKILKKQGYLNSYNQNARYYTLREIADFDENGLWSYGEASFSRYGNVMDTIIALVEKSDNGYRIKELEKLLDAAVQPRLGELIKQERLDREKIGASYVYVSASERRGHRQLEARREAQERKMLRQLPDKKHTVAVLVEMLSGGSRRAHNVARRLQRQGVQVSSPEVRKIVEYYDLDVSKKTLSECKC